jgi:hypothetical protein
MVRWVREMNGSIGKFEIQSRLGRGGMADVYRCSRKGIGGFEKVVVVKCIRSERAGDPEFVRLFLDEARLAANLNHPNIVQIFEIDEVNGTPYIAMEYVPGPTLAALLRRAQRAGRREPGHACQVLAGVCEGLHYAHTATSPAGQPLGLVHRDVSPQNIIVSREGVPKLLDFGVAKANDRSAEARTVRGKLRYISPEQLTGTVDHRADVFAVGVCLFEATTGQSPHGSAANDELSLLGSVAKGPRLRPSEVVADYPPGLEEIVLWAIEPDPERRCPSARQLHDALEAYVAHGPQASGTRAVASWVAELFPEIEERISGGPLPGELGETAPELPTWVPPAGPPGRGLSIRRGLAARGPLLAGAMALIAGTALGVLPARHSAPGARPEPSLAPRCEAPVESPLGTPIALASALPPSERSLATGGSRRRRYARAPRPATTVSRPMVVPPAPAPPPFARTFAAVESAPRPVSTAPERVARPPSAEDPAHVYSGHPLGSIPRPNLPRAYRAQGSEDLQRILTAVEQETLRAGCSADFARGITAGAHRTLASQRAAEVFPAAMYYFIINEAALGREKRTAEEELRQALGSGIIRALTRLPAQ